MTTYVDIGKRLEHERLRLEETKISFSKRGGISRQSQSNYEKGKRCPDTAYLIAIATAGADLCYILTGNRSAPATVVSESPAPYEAADLEQQLLTLYRDLPPEKQRILVAIAQVLCEKQTNSELTSHREIT